MKRAPVIIAIALVVAAVAPGRDELEANAVQNGQAAEMQQLAPAQPGTSTGGQSEMEGFAYTLDFTQPDHLSGPLSSAWAYPNQWGGAEFDRMSTVQALEQNGHWDSLPEASQITLSVPGKDIERVEICFDPNTRYNPKNGLPETDDPTYTPKSVSMTPEEDGQLHTCSFPVSFLSADGQQVYDQLFCVIRVTFRDGDSCDIACALSRKD